MKDFMGVPEICEATLYSWDELVKQGHDVCIYDPDVEEFARVPEPEKIEPIDYGDDCYIDIDGRYTGDMEELFADIGRTVKLYAHSGHTVAAPNLRFYKENPEDMWGVYSISPAMVKRIMPQQNLVVLAGKKEICRVDSSY